MKKVVAKIAKVLLKIVVAIVLLIAVFDFLVHYSYSCVSCINNHIDVPVKGVTLNCESINLGVKEDYAFNVDIIPERANNRAITYSSSNEQVVKIDGDFIIGVAEGTAVITVTTEDGGYTDTCNVVVKGVFNPSEGLEYVKDDDYRNTYYYSKWYSEWYVVTGLGTCTDKDIVIPNYYEGLPVRYIGSEAFQNCNSIRSVKLGKNVSYIDDSAFSGCLNLEKIEIPRTLGYINYFAFEDCKSLKGVYIEDLSRWCEMGFEYGYSNPLTYAKKLYLNGELITNLVIPDTISKIGNYAFNYGEFDSVVIPEGVTTISDSAFNSSTLNTVSLPNSLTFIGKHAFSYCYSLNSIVIPKNVKTIDYMAFDGCYNLVEVYNLTSKDIRDYFEYATNFYYDINMPTSFKVTEDGFEYYYDEINCVYKLVGYIGKETNLILPEKLEDNYYEIGEYAFFKKSIESVIIPYGVIGIGDCAFSKCSLLKRVEISSTVETIGYGVFWDCKNLSVVEFEIESKLTNLGNFVFENCSNLTSIVIPEKVYNVNETTFENCFKLVEIYNLTRLDVSNYCNSAIVIHTDINEPSSLVTTSEGFVIYVNPTKNDYRLVSYVGNKSEITLPSEYNGNNLTMNDYVFSDCYWLTKVVISEGIKNISYCAFNNCTNLIDVVIPNSMITVCENAFANCTDINYLEEEGLKYLGNQENPYHYLAGVISNDITEINLNANCKIIGCSAFEKCAKLSSADIPDGIVAISDRAFYNCFALVSVNLPSSLKSIGSEVFYSCGSLVSITIPENVTSIGTKTFSQCYALNDVIFALPQNWYKTAFYNDWKFKENGEICEISDFSEMAKLLRGEYHNSFWYKIEQ